MMDANTKHPTESSPIPTGVYDIDALQTECEMIGVAPTRPNIRRMRRAIDLHQSGAVRPNPTHDIFFVKSQTDADTTYCVMPHSGCDCPDAHRLNAEFGDKLSFQAAWMRINESQIRCKHEIAVSLWKEQRRDQEMCDAHDALEAISDDSLVHSDPVDEIPF